MPDHPTITGFYWIKLRWEPNKWTICYIGESENLSTSPYVEVFGSYIETMRELNECVIEYGPRIQEPTQEGDPT